MEEAKQKERKTIEEEKKESGPSLDNLQEFRDNMKEFRKKAKGIIGEATEKNKEDLTPESKESVEKVIEDLTFKKDNKILDARSVEVKPFYFIKHVKGDRENTKEKSKLDKKALIEKPLDKKQQAKRETIKEFIGRKRRRFQAYRRLMKMKQARENKKNKLVSLVKMVRLSFSRKPKQEVQKNNPQNRRQQGKPSMREPKPGPYNQGKGR